MARLDWYIRSRLKLSHFQLIIALDDRRHIGKTAAFLNVSQPAISKALSSLEESLGFPLFTRTTRGIEPSELGACLIEKARDIVSQLLILGEEIDDLKEGRVAKISLGVLPVAASVLIPSFIAKINKENKGITFSVKEGTMDTLMPLLRTGEINFIVGNHPARPLSPEFEKELLYEDPITALVRKDHPLTKSKDIQWEDIKDYSLILPTKDALTRSNIESFFADKNINIPISRLESISTLSNIGVLQFTDAVWLGARTLGEYWQQIGVLSPLPLLIPKTAIQIGLIWMTEQKSPVHNLILKNFRDARDSIIESITVDSPDMEKPPK